MKKIIYIEGMSCDHCRARVEKALNAIEGVEAQVDLENRSASVTLNKSIEDEILKSVITEAGYEVISINPA